MKRVLFCTIFLGLLCPSSILGGTKEEIVRLQSDVLQLQELIRTLQKAIDDKNGVMLSLLEQLNDQVAKGNLDNDEMKTAVNAARTQTLTLESVVQELRDDMQLLSTKFDDTNNRIASLQRRLEENQMQIQTLRTVPTEPGAELDPDRVYSASYNDYLMGNYALAIDGFRDYLASYPESEYADNAAYYLGDCYLQQGRQELAIQAFDQLINLYPKGDKTPVAYFKKAVAQQEMQRMEDAIATLKALSKLYPDTREAKLAEEELAKFGLGRTS
jgi:tol-pal system protein YbgF